LSDDPFGAVKPKPKTAQKSKALDFEGLPPAPGAPSAEREAAAIMVGESLGYVSRESAQEKAIEPYLEASGSQGQPGTKQGAGGGSVVRRRPGGNVPMRSIFVKGPESDINEFVAFVNEKGYSAYWEAIRDLMANRPR
jgi:hypothetical protein